MDGHSDSSRCVAVLLREYRPTHVSDADWAAVRSDVIETTRNYRGTDTSSRKVLSHLAPFAAWARSEGAPGLADALHDPDWIERYIATGMPDAADSTRATRRATLRRIADRVNVEGPPPPVPLAYRVLKPPYRSWEVSRYLELAEGQPTAARRRSLTAVLALGLGAGLDGRDMAWVRGADIARSGSIVTVSVCGGSRPRSVVGLDRYADTIARCAAKAGDELLIGGRSLGRHNVTSVALTRLINDKTLPTLLASRLRSTWLTTHLNLATPLALLLPAAGLATARPLGDLLPHVDPIAADRAAVVMAGPSA